MYIEKLHYEFDNLLNIKVWLPGELLNENEQLSIQFRKDSDNKYNPVLGFSNLSDGIDFESLDEITKFVKSHKSKLENMHYQCIEST